MKKEQQTDGRRPESDQTMPAEMESRRVDMMPRNLNHDGMKGVVGIIIWFVIVVLIFCLMFFLS